MRKLERSKAAYDEALTLMPGGVNSPVRAFRSVGLDPVFIEKGKGAYVEDIDGNRYIDFLQSWGPMILGHANDSVVEAIQSAATKGTSFGTSSLIENEMAKLLIERLPSVDMVRMVSSGTEATMSALRLARGYTGRDKIVKFEGCYHGHGDSLLIKAGSGVVTLGLPDSPGVPEGVAVNTISVPFNNLEQLAAVFDTYGSEIAAVITEPISGNMGCVPPVPGFLEGIRALTKEHGALFIMDEVMTGFRTGYHSAQGYYNIDPDITCFGKIVGGGLPVGAFGGKKHIMEKIAPAGPIYQAGTMSGNPLAMASGIATLSQLTEASYQGIEKHAMRLEDGILAAAKSCAVPITCNRVGAMICFFFTNTNVIDYETARTADVTYFAKFYKEMLEQGILIPPSQFETWFLSTVLTDDDIEQTIIAARNAFQTLHENKSDHGSR